jgi:hypothetical protein
MKKLSILAIGLILGGCVTVTPTFTANGKQGHNIDCSTSLSTWGSCYQKAGEICGAKGYNVIAKEGDTQSSLSGGRHGVFGSTEATRTLIIECKR